jgi:hypothetical protein
MANVAKALLLSVAVAHSALLAPGTAMRTLGLRHAPVSMAAAKLTDANGNEIKAALSAYMHFCAEHRPTLTTQLKAQHGAAFKQPLVMSSLGAAWKQLSDSEKVRFESLAKADKERFEAAVASNPENAKVKRRSAKKTSSGPKKLSAYIHFCNDRRTSLTAELKASMGATYKNTAVMKALGEEWKTVDAATKARYTERAQQPVA